jgi:arsenate reductase-like glutaredoxin family protein
VRTLIVAKGKKVTRVDLSKERPDDDALAAMLLGPTGNLRAPTMRSGRTMLVGFNEDMYGELVG